MLKNRPATIDVQLYGTPDAPAVADVVPWNVVPAPQNPLVPRAQLARVPVPEGFSTDLTQINKGR
jgi:hypothetical protein